MKVLIADDQSRRYQRLFKELASIGLEREDISLVPSASDARNELESKEYDLLILDILLPNYPEDDPDSNQHSLDLLFDIQEGDELNKPKMILGITGDIDSTGNASEKFNESTWNVIEYSDSDDSWITQICNCIAYLTSSLDPSDKPGEKSVDLVIVCALQKPELSEVLKLPWNWSEPRPISDTIFVHDGYFDIDGKQYTVAATFAPRMGMVSTALRTAAMINTFKPKVVTMCGICAGVKEKVKMGDVLLADPAWDFQSGKRVIDQSDNKSFSIAPHQIPCDPVIRSHLEQIKADQDSFIKMAQDADRTDLIPELQIGPVASGSAVLADGEVINEIKSQQRDLIGVEMEVYGLYSSASVAGEPRPKVFALKSVCDFADPDKADGIQKYAAYTSARTLELLMQKYASRILN
ncbi:hypothetical protein [Neptuniibacter sp. 1_MG-2023]|uniref:5'-methylthioadenosine/S-adenosylhomocysteine nucleosidase family protein n=1 Tax=Neptuniibacter sp. 1_MG-2023 TaxID=3062662 RepID=UPI0026E42704|nr:hypothetical protein [Neptuniibacter sp. 1_MG-2023]MDO6594119.1 hypothetical protein [Neptuniibacter sp. 1_MG-2023]